MNDGLIFMLFLSAPAASARHATRSREKKVNKELDAAFSIFTSLRPTPVLLKVELFIADE
jgi:hypothetical protein